MSEEPHEWVGSRDQTPGSRDLASAPRRWRLELQHSRLVRGVPPCSLECRLVAHNADEQTEVGAFAKWRVLLAVSKQLLPAFRRLLEAGGCRFIRDRQAPALWSEFCPKASLTIASFCSRLNSSPLPSQSAIRHRRGDARST